MTFDCKIKNSLHHEYAENHWMKCFIDLSVKIEKKIIYIINPGEIFILTPPPQKKKIEKSWYNKDF